MISVAAELHGAHIELNIQEDYPPVVNDPSCCEIARLAAAEAVGSQNITAAEHPSMGSEDFSFYLNEVPGCFARLGARRADWEPIPLHSPSFEVDPRVLDVGALYFEQVARLASERAGTGNGHV